MNQTAYEEFLRWRDSSVFDIRTREELRAIENEKEIEDRFYRGLSFGTGGLRGLLGAGTNRMNIYTVGKTTQGLANYINGLPGEKSVVVAYDSRRMSPEFALDSALILVANRIKVYLFESLRPTPELSFAVRYFKATAGIVITASHNPPEYNGYKVYFRDGGQIVPPQDRLIIDAVNAVKDYSEIRRVTEEECLESGLFKLVGEEVDRAYADELKALVLSPDAIQRSAKELRIVYTPLNGTGFVPVTGILKELGFENVWVVPEQAQPDGNFPTVTRPNPEDPDAFRLALMLAREKNADLVLATDPDADRLGVYVWDPVGGEYRRFTGNMSGLLIAEYELFRKRELGLLPQRKGDGAIVTTIVSSKMAYPMAEEYGATVIETLTGFKYIGEQINRFEAAKAENGGETDGAKGAFEYLFGYEESYGCLIGTYARDKDAISACMALCEAAVYYKERGLTLWEQMLRIYEKYGYYVEDLLERTYTGAEGVKRIYSITERLRREPPQSFGGRRVVATRDYLGGIRTDEKGEKGELLLPKSDVLYYELEDGGWCCVRPSGTESKIKLYFGCRESSLRDAQNAMQDLKEDLIRYLG